jgi:hypothetical protein
VCRRCSSRLGSGPRGRTGSHRCDSTYNHRSGFSRWAAGHPRVHLEGTHESARGPVEDARLPLERRASSRERKVVIGRVVEPVQHLSAGPADTQIVPALYGRMSRDSCRPAADQSAYAGWHLEIETLLKSRAGAGQCGERRKLTKLSCGRPAWPVHTEPQRLRSRARGQLVGFQGIRWKTSPAAVLQSQLQLSAWTSAGSGRRALRWRFFQSSDWPVFRRWATEPPGAIRTACNGLDGLELL